MATKIRLQRHGKKDSAFFHIVIADGRAPRDGKFIEKIGTYNPNTNPATIDLNFDKAFDWVMTGATPTDTCRAILKYKGVLMKKHLAIGVKKGALTQEQADAKLAKWLTDKEARISKGASDIETKKQEENRKRLADEKAVKEARSKAIAEKQAAAAAAAAEAPAAAEGEAPAAEEASAE